MKGAGSIVWQKSLLPAAAALRAGIVTFAATVAGVLARHLAQQWALANAPEPNSDFAKIILSTSAASYGRRPRDTVPNGADRGTRHRAGTDVA